MTHPTENFFVQAFHLITFTFPLGSQIDWTLAGEIQNNKNHFVSQIKSTSLLLASYFIRLDCGN